MTSEAKGRSMPYLTSARGDRPAVLQLHAGAQREGPGPAVRRRRPEVGGEVRDDLVGVAGLGPVRDQVAGVEPHDVPHARQVRPLRVQAVDLGRDDPERAAGAVRGGAHAGPPASALPPTTGTSARPPAPPPQLTAKTTTRTTTAATARIRRRDQPRAQAGSRLASRSSVVFSAPAAAPPPCAAGGGPGQLPPAAFDRSGRTRRRPGWRRRRAHRPCPARPGSRPCSPPSPTRRRGYGRRRPVSGPNRSASRARTRRTLLRVLRGGHLAGTDRPHRLVGDTTVAELLGGQPLEGGVELARVQCSTCPPAFADLQPLADADDRGRCRAASAACTLRRHQGVVLDVAPPGARCGRRPRTAAPAPASIGPLTSPVYAPLSCSERSWAPYPIGSLSPVDQRLHAAQLGERRQHHDLDRVQLRLGADERDLLHQRDGLEVR